MRLLQRLLHGCYNRGCYRLTGFLRLVLFTETLSKGRCMIPGNCDEALSPRLAPKPQTRSRPNRLGPKPQTRNRPNPSSFDGAEGPRWALQASGVRNHEATASVFIAGRKPVLPQPFTIRQPSTPSTVTPNSTTNIDTTSKFVLLLILLL